MRTLSLDPPEYLAYMSAQKEKYKSEIKDTVVNIGLNNDINPNNKQKLEF